jgi:hypothetical protein
MNRSRLESEAFALSELIGRSEVRHVPGEVAIAFLRLNSEAERLAGSDEQVPLELLREAITAFRAMPEAPRLRLMNGWSLAPLHAGEQDVHRANAECGMARFLVIESFGETRAEEPRAFQDFCFDHQSNPPVTVHVREGASKVETMRALDMIARHLNFNWREWIDHHNVESGLAMAFIEDAAGRDRGEHGQEAHATGTEKSGVSATRPTRPTPASNGTGRAAEQTAA